MRFGIMLGIILFALSARAGCPVADAQARTGSLSKALSAYQHCALQKGDDDTQLYLAEIYEKGKGDVPKNTQRALLFYHLSSENGNAKAMVGLSKLMSQLDESDAGRAELTTYLTKIRRATSTSGISSFAGQILHPYALLVLASEKPESKWFYQTTVKSDPTASNLLKAYQIEPDKKDQVIKQATQWKQRKMLDIARKVFSVDEFNEFYDTLYPDNGLPNAFERSQAVNRLKERIESRTK